MTSLRSFSTTVSAAVTAAQASCTSLLNLTVGTPGRAILEATSGVGMWLQYVLLQILARNRLSTSQGSDVDSFVADFGFSRLPGTAATGNVTFLSFSPASSSAVIPVGALARTVSGVSYAVVADSTQPTWSTSANGYIRAAGVASITVPVACAQAGSIGNTASGAICLLGSSISGIDTVTNSTALTNGSDAQSDASVRSAFVSWLASLDRATLSSIETAVQGIAANIDCEGVENVDAAGNFYPGNIVLYVDDGSGDASDALLAQAYSVANAYRASPASIQVVRPTVVRPVVSMSLTLAQGADQGATQTAVSNAIAAYFNGLGIGQGAIYTKIVQLIYGASSSIVSVSNVALNGGTSDIPGVTGTVLRAGVVSYD